MTSVAYREPAMSRVWHPVVGLLPVTQCDAVPRIRQAMKRE
jgi:hypothetical protein